MTDTDIKVYTTEEALEILKVTRRTLYNYIKAGQLHAVKVGRDWRISEDDLKDFLNKGTEDNYLDKIGASRKKPEQEQEQ